MNNRTSTDDLHLQVDIQGLKLNGYHGLYDEERIRGQLFGIDISYRYYRCSNSTDTEDGIINYVPIIDLVKNRFEAERSLTLEALVTTFSKAIMEHDKRILWLSVRVGKFNPPISDVFGGVWLTKQSTR